jgi:hypothetical protein
VKLLFQAFLNAICPMFKSYEIIKFVPRTAQGNSKEEADVAYSLVLREPLFSKSESTK